MIILLVFEKKKCYIIGTKYCVNNSQNIYHNQYDILEAKGKEVMGNDE